MRQISTRADDELLLKWLALRAGGLSSYRIAQDYGVSSERVRTATQRVLADDLKLSRECPKRVASHYWPQRMGAA